MLEEKLMIVISKFPITIGGNSVTRVFSFVNQYIPDDVCAYGVKARFEKQ
jgi:hypothetical protein